jgi:DegV family protein with EDD domain
VSPVRIVVDSLADIPPALVDELHITVIPAIVRFGDEEFEDGVSLTSAEFYTRLQSSPSLPQTAVPPLGVFEAMYRRLASETSQIISIHVPAGLSGMVNAATIAARSLPDVWIEVVDSTNMSMAQGWLAVLAARAAREGQSMEEIVALVRATIPKVRL